MKKMNVYRLMSITAMVALMFSLTYCKKEKETETVTVTVHDTLKGKAITGTATYPDFDGVATKAAGAVINLYLGSSVSGTVVATTFADVDGNYTLPYLLPGTYFLTAKYNTENKNFRYVDGVNFVTDPGYVITMASVNIVQDIQLVNQAAVGNLKIALDTINANQSYRDVSWEIHSKLDFAFPDHEGGAILPGGFNVFEVTDFVFNESDPSQIKIDGYVLLSSVNTFEPVRDALAAGCVRKTFCVDTIDAFTALPETDTARFYSVSVEKYGDGYLCHGILRSFYKTGFGSIYPPDTTLGYAGPFDTMIEKPVDMYFVYEGKTKWISGANYNWAFIFEGQFKFNPKADYYISSSHIGAGDVTVNCHVQMKGATNTEY
ncbi:MAG TPA: hypothetical protein PLU53_10945 [Bacteroidia bacterium]|nr:hypothetical protein [Bacteroidia bacterium]